ncbi:hypothetical protein DFH27DRAFT_361261 [Peziza echinospora]|nr:hypothetical protein DFH27DRAFT_361261 [Peziza echinospora]
MITLFGFFMVVFSYFIVIAFLVIAIDRITCWVYALRYCWPYWVWVWGSIRVWIWIWDLARIWKGGFFLFIFISDYYTYIYTRTYLGYIDIS